MSGLNDLNEEFFNNIKSKDQQRCIDILNKLSECEGFDVNAPIMSDGDTFLMIAAYNGCLDVVKHLIEVLCANPNIQNNFGWTALHYASQQNRYKIIDYLISVPGIDVNKQNNEGWTTLHFAAALGLKDNVKALLRSNELDTSLRDCNGKTAEEVARIFGYHEIADMIAAYEPSISTFDNK